MKQFADFPVKHIEQNLVFGTDGTVWAYFHVEGYGYDFRDNEQKKKPFKNQMALLTKNQYDLHLLSIPFKMDVTRIIDQTIEEVKRKDYELKDHGLRYLNALKTTIKESVYQSDTNQYVSYFGVQLDPKKNVYIDGNQGTKLLASFKQFLKGINSPVYKAVGLERFDILHSEIQAFKDQAATIASDLSDAFSSPVRPISTAEALFLTEYSFSVPGGEYSSSISKIGVDVEGTDYTGRTYQAVRPDKKLFLDLQSAEVEEYDPKTLRLRKLVDNEIKEQYVQYLVVSRMSTVVSHPGTEWLYRIQTDLPFPVGTSIRAFYKSNEEIQKNLSNALLEFEDQRKTAREVGANIDEKTASSEQGAIKMQAMFAQSGEPAYDISIVLRVTAGDKIELKQRVEKVRTELGKKGMTLQIPYGEAISYFMEFIPGSKRYTTDYLQTVSAGVIASAMFGATTNIGDSRGFPIGFTKKLKKPVFIQPDLAAKAYDNIQNVFDSLSMMIAGETGKGKSVLMNLLATLGALTGSHVMITDPKGDRAGWAEGLPFIPKEYISVWTLGESEEEAGCLDPFRTSENISDAKDIALDILTYLTNVQLDDDRYSLLSDAIEVAGDFHDPCIEVVINHLKDQYENRPEYMSDERHRALETLLTSLQSLQKNKLATLLFGKINQDYKTLDVGKPIQVLMVQNLQLPDIKKGQTGKIRAPQKISEAILISITAFTKQFMFKLDRKGTHKIVVQDEAKTIERSVTGAEQLDFIERKGRYYNTTLIKGTQNASDYDNAANIGMKFCFQLYQSEEAEKMLQFLNLPVTASNVSTLKNLKRGQALFQDIYGRCAVIEVNTVFQDFIKAFDSSTADEADRERERTRSLEKQSSGVGV
ncbi:ATP-binding protein [Bacillus pumilus]|uniref:ATP-binding protein n=1 Tax=Bacillus pumilus TaxID=1408 RepID=UPI00119DF595|nr:ATP-binding protein [Bacillus pumilus]